MLTVFVDSGSSIKQEEKEKYNVEILPLKILLNGKEYLDGVDLTMETFYHELIENKQFPMTSLPSMQEAQDRVNACTAAGDDVIILAISSKISGTYNALRLAFEDNPKVRVIDTLTAVGGVRILVDEINRHREKPLDEVVQIVKNLIPRIKILAIPETLTYLYRGGRLSKLSFVVGTVLKINPIISFKNGGVVVDAKKRGLKASMQHITDAIAQTCDPNYEIVASYTYSKTNLETMIGMTDEKFKPQINVFDNLDPAIAAHWGPNAFGYIFVTKK